MGQAYVSVGAVSASGVQYDRSNQVSMKHSSGESNSSEDGFPYKAASQTCQREDMDN
jgi:hypothetical protein